MTTFVIASKAKQSLLTYPTGLLHPTGNNKQSTWQISSYPCLFFKTCYPQLMSESDSSPEFELDSDQLESMGRNITYYISRLLKDYSVDPQLVKDRGALLLDVGEGPEIYGIHPFAPKKCLVGEPNYDLDPQSFPFFPSSALPTPELEIRHDTAQNIVSALATHHPDQKFGLITRLNLWPAEIEVDKLTKFLDSASKIIDPEGLIILSVQEPHERPTLEEVIDQGVNGLDLSLYTFKQQGNSIFITHAGALALVARPSPDPVQPSSE